MKAIGPLALLLFAIASPARSACPVATPDSGQFHVTASKRCNAASPCLTTDTLTFTLTKNTACYPSWVPCPGYTIQSCDLVTWNFDDGSAPVPVVGQSTISHRFPAGRHQVQVTVRNARGSATHYYDLFVGMTPPAYVSFEHDAYTFNEGDGVATLHVVRTGETSRTVPIEFEVGAGPLVPTRGQIVFAPGETQKSIAVPIVDDHTRHGWYPTWVFLYQYGGEAILRDGYVASTLVTVIDDDPQVVVTPVLEQRSYVEGATPTPVTIGIHLSAPQVEPVRLIATVWDVKGTASWGSDWRAHMEDIEIPPGQTEASYEVEILADSLPEPTETLVIYLGPPNNTTDVLPAFSGWPVTITILDDDAATNPVTAQMNPSSLALQPGQRAEAFFATAAAPELRTVTFTSSNPSVAYVMMAERGLMPAYPALAFDVFAGAPGTATIIGRLPNGLSASLVVHVSGALAPPLPDLAFVPGFVDAAVGSTAQVTLQAGNGTASPRSVTLTAGNPAVITVPATVTIPANGNSVEFGVTAKSGGYSTLTAKMPDGRSTIIAVTVTEPAPALSMTAPAAVRVGTVQSSTLTLTPAASSKVTLKASRSGIVTMPSSLTLRADGVGTLPILGKKAGSVTITATTRARTGKILTSTVNVTVTRK